MKIAWALDIFPQEENELESAATVLRAFSKLADCQVHPVYVLNLHHFSEVIPLLGPGQFGMNHFSQAEQSALKIMQGDLARLKDPIPGLKSPRVLVHSNRGYSSNLEYLNDFLEEQEFDLVLLYTHSKKGLQRMLLGSFAETLLIHSKVPVCVVNPRAQRAQSLEQGFKKILYATDFSDSSREILRELLQRYTYRPLELTVFHHLVDRISPLLASGAHFLGGDMPAYDELRATQKTQALERLEDFSAQIQQSGVHVHPFLSSGDLRVADAIVKKAQEGGCDMIAVSSHSGTLYSTLVGSVTRQIVRSSDLPVWVIPSHSRWAQKKSKDLSQLSHTAI